MNRMFLGRFGLITFALLLVVTGCAKENAEDTTPAKVASEGTPLRPKAPNLKGLTANKIDLNGDGKSDQVKYYKRSTDELVLIMRDLNFDGSVDLYEYYENNQLVREETTLDFDKNLDLVTVYDDGNAQKKHYSIKFDGLLSGTYHFDEQGNIIKIEDNNEKKFSW